METSPFSVYPRSLSCFQQLRILGENVERAQAPLDPQGLENSIQFRGV